MKIDDTYIFDAPPDLLWSLLHDPAVMRQAIPGCDHFHLHADGKYHISLTLASGPFAGYYEAVLTRLDERPQESIRLSLTGSGPETVFSGEGTLSLAESGEQTRLFYEGGVEVSGQIPSQSPRLTRTTTNFLIRSFMEGLEQQINEIAGVAGSNGLPLAEAAVVERTTPTIGMQDFLAELRRDRWIAAAAIIAALLSVLSLLGAVFVGSLAVRWLTRSFAGGASQSPNNQPGGDLPAEEL